MTTAQRTRATDTIGRKGQTVSIVGSTPGAYNTATGTATPTSYSKSAKAVLLPLSHAKKMGGSNIKEGDETLLIAGLDTSGAALPEPPVNATVTLADGSTKLTLIASERLNPEGDGSIFYDCIARRAA